MYRLDEGFKDEIEGLRPGTFESRDGSTEASDRRALGAPDRGGGTSSSTEEMVEVVLLVGMF